VIRATFIAYNQNMYKISARWLKIESEILQTIN